MTEQNSADDAPNALFAALVAASGLAPMLAPASMTRALARSGATPRTLTRTELSRALPAIQQALKVYLPDDQVAARMRAITALAAATT